MYPRTHYEMTEEDLKAILDACKPVPVMFLSGGTPIGGSLQGNANRAWAKLGKEMGFDHMTVRPIPNASQRYFTAIPSETETQRDERLQHEAEERRQAEIARLKIEIAERQERLSTLNVPERETETQQG